MIRLFLLIVSVFAFISLSANSTDMAYAIKHQCDNANSSLPDCESQNEDYSVVTVARQIARSSSQGLVAESDSDVQAKGLEWNEDMDNSNADIESEIPSVVSAIPFP